MDDLHRRGPPTESLKSIEAGRADLAARQVGVPAAFNPDRHEERYRTLTACYNGEAMTEKPADDPVLTRFRAAVTEIYGERVERVVLFGSRARGDAKPDSDYDTAVFLKDAGTFTVECKRLADVSTEILFALGAVISATPFPAGAYRERTGFMHELRKDGLDL
jgi:predicted nucleotidyltransferase